MQNPQNNGEFKAESAAEKRLLIVYNAFCE